MGDGDRASSVNFQSTESMIHRANTNVKPVSSMYIIAGPNIIRTALRSLVARAMTSPVRYLA